MTLLRNLLLLYIAPLVFINPSTGENILMFLPTNSYSHFKPLEPLFQELAMRGHNVTVFSKFSLAKNISNYSSIVFSAEIEFVNIGMGNLRKQSRIYNWIYVHNEIQNYFTQLISYNKVQELLNSKDTQFDLIFIELYHGDGAFALSHRFNCPIIGLSFQPILPIYNWLIGNPTTFSYIPHIYLPFTDIMNFWKRTINAAFYIFTAAFYNFVSIKGYQKHVDLLLRQTKNPELNIEKLSESLSLILAEFHFSSAYTRPNLPNVIDIAGIHIQSPKPLPQDLLDFLDQSEYGVVYVSLGTLIDPVHADHLGLNLMNVFRKLRQRVIWKWKKEFFHDVPKNVLIGEWFPQIDILNHPRCKLFISHGGYHSLLESIYSAVPILGIPFFTDQHHNTAIIEKLKIGKKASTEASEEELLFAVEELLSNETFQRNSQHQSSIFRDRPMSPMDTAIYWTEYILRYKGASHMKSAVADLYWFQYILLDIILFYSVIVLILFCILRVFFKMLTKQFKGANSKELLFQSRQKLNKN